MNLNTVSAMYGIGNVVSKLTGGSTLGSLISPGYRPSQWKSGGDALLTKATNIDGIFFDAILNSSHESTLTVTKHPVQNGSNVSDHAILNPPRLSLSVAVSDAMAQYGPAYKGAGGTKSVKAYQTLRDLQAQRIPLKVWTKLQTYENMVITSVTADDDYTTAYALRANIELEQILVVNVSETKVSARQWTTGGGTQNNSQPEPIEDESLAAKIGGDGEKGLRYKK